MNSNLSEDNESPLVTDRWYVNFFENLRSYSRQNPLFLLFILVMLPVTIFALESTLSYLSKAQSQPKVFIYFTPDTLSLTRNTNVKIMMDVPAGNVNFARVTFSFDKNKLRLTGGILTSPQLSTVIEKTPIIQANGTGMAKIVLAAAPGGQLPQGTFEFASINIEPLASNLSPNEIKFVSSDIQVVDNSQLVYSPVVTNLKLNPNGPTETPAVTITPTQIPTLIPTVIPSSPPTVVPSRRPSIQPTQPPQSGLNPGEVGVRFIPNQVSMPPNQTVKIQLNSQSREVAFAKVTFKFDRTKVRLSAEIKSNPNLSTIIEKTSMHEANNTGTARIVIAASPSDVMPKNQFDFAEISLNPVNNNIGRTGINFAYGDIQVVDLDAEVLTPKFVNLGINGPPDPAPIISIRPTRFPESLTIRFKQPDVNIPPDSNQAIILASPSRRIAFIKAVFSFDNTKLMLKNEITLSPKFSNIIQKTSMRQANNTGKVIITVASSPSDLPVSGDIEIASLLLGSVAGASNETRVEFIEKEMQIVDEEENALPVNGIDLLVNGQSPGGVCQDRGTVTCFRQWVKEFMGTTQTKITDFNGDGRVDLQDFETIRRASFNKLGLSSIGL